jgi:ligand-binding sensor domain-containing protein
MSIRNWVEKNVFSALVVLAIMSCYANVIMANNGFYTPITSIQGLSQNEVRCIVQDKKGYLWIGTQDGLNQYDGYEFQKYSRIPFEKNSLSSDFVNVLLEDDKERLWIGTIDGLDVLDKSRSKFTNLTSNHKNHLPMLHQSFRSRKKIILYPLYRSSIF